MSAFGLVEAHGDRTLAAVDGQVVPRFPGVFAVGPFQERRTPRTRVVTRTRTLDLDDVGAEIGKDLSSPGCGQDAAQVENLDVGERGCVKVHHGLSDPAS